MAVREVNRTVTVVIPSKDEGGWVKSTVEGVLQVSGPLLQAVVVVDDGSKDGSCERLEELGRQVPVRVISTAGVGVSHAKNLGAAEASGDVVVFLDAHSRVEQGWLEEICQVLDMGHAGAAPLVSLFDKDERVVHPGMLGQMVSVRPAALRGRGLDRGQRRGNPSRTRRVPGFSLGVI